MRISDWSSDVCSSDLLDSPMAINATDLLHAHSDDHRLTHDECASICKIATYTRDVESSKAITASVFPKVVISDSGMATRTEERRVGKEWGSTGSCRGPTAQQTKNNRNNQKNNI